MINVIVAVESEKGKREELDEQHASELQVFKQQAEQLLAKYEESNRKYRQLEENKEETIQELQKQLKQNNSTSNSNSSKSNNDQTLIQCLTIVDQSLKEYSTTGDKNKAVNLFVNQLITHKSFTNKGK